jgi:hypothetical protein
LNDAWCEWEQSEKEQLLSPDESLLDANLREAVAQAWKDPSKEFAVRDLWKEVSTGVFLCQFFDPKRLADLRHYLENATDAQIPTRPPYGIVLNRRGMMLDCRSEGFSPH